MNAISFNNTSENTHIAQDMLWQTNTQKVKISVFFQWCFIRESLDMNGDNMFYSLRRSIDFQRSTVAGQPTLGIIFYHPTQPLPTFRAIKHYKYCPLPQYLLWPYYKRGFSFLLNNITIVIIIVITFDVNCGGDWLGFGGGTRRDPEATSREGHEREPRLKVVIVIIPTTIALVMVATILKMIPMTMLIYVMMICLCIFP